MLTKKNLIIALSVISVIVLFFIFSGKEEQSDNIEAVVKQGIFEVNVTSTGELEAENSENIPGPNGLRKIRVYNVKITDLVPEGTVVDSGEYVATLDRSEVTSKLKDIEADIEAAESNFIKEQLDTTLELRKLRDDLINKEFDLEEKKINLEQSQYEPPATIRQAEILLNKVKRDYEQSIKSYKLKVRQARVKMKEAELKLAKSTRKRDDIMDIMNQFEVKAPKKGMVIYFKEWNGKKRKVGSTINPWENMVATLPDLSTMVSKTFVNEIDIRKVTKGQKVEIEVDAFPEKKFEGKVISVANVGEQLPNSDAKVFEVSIILNESDTVLRPSMTTSNTIITNSFDDVVYIPIEALLVTDSLTFVYKKEGLSHKKLQIETGVANENEIIVTKGLKEGDIILLSLPNLKNKLDEEI
ncbi:MAG: RND transporter [Bacteroidetes bacterium]|nr:MAG: RND transporter [Bacteroidota bacterium]